jgi:hypothetical protein
MQNVLIYSLSGAGKSMITEKFVRDHPLEFGVNTISARNRVNANAAPPSRDRVCEWLDVDSDLTGLELFERLQRKSPGLYPEVIGAECV